jgi:hypothetical protein
MYSEQAPEPKIKNVIDFLFFSLERKEAKVQGCKKSY